VVGLGGATKDGIGRAPQGRALPSTYGWWWALHAILSEALREVGNALVADGDQRDDGEGVGVPHWVLRAEEDTPIGLPTERALEPGRVRWRFSDDLRLLVLICLEVRLFVPQGVDVGIATRRIASLFHRLPPIA
jgi:hypothetical protein